MRAENEVYRLNRLIGELESNLASAGEMRFKLPSRAQNEVLGVLEAYWRLRGMLGSSAGQNEVYRRVARTKASRARQLVVTAPKRGSGVRTGARSAAARRILAETRFSGEGRARGARGERGSPAKLLEEPGKRAKRLGRVGSAWARYIVFYRNDIPCVNQAQSPCGYLDFFRWVPVRVPIQDSNAQYSPFDRQRTEAVTGLIPVFPTVTFPNHYSIVTGLYPAYHGIINNRFVDPITGEVFTMRSHEPKWWLGEPLWETVANHGLRAATYFGLGLRCIKVLGIALKGFGHLVGPDDPEITEAVSGIDKMIGRLINGLEKRGVFEDVHIIMLNGYSTILNALNSPPSRCVTIERCWEDKRRTAVGKVQNGKHLKVYLKEELPSRLHYSVSDRIPPIIGLVEEGFEVEQKRSKHQECGGAHGYDNAFFSMRTIFIGHGPHFARGRKVPSFENIQIYNLVTSILNIKGAPNNGSLSFPGSVLLLLLSKYLLTSSIVVSSSQMNCSWAGQFYCDAT
ncbi:hypothetical protein GH714_001045 [Hevea brasiliensis]|uniref:Uncharacterized protein n=1 Tax=Hevea brasiliensis TaxID=3981 RepID=A0A6A6KWL0_HEVBR|nr:hypothetical protein GH714_001045 [Hevea brasiliensis]